MKKHTLIRFLKRQYRLLGVAALCIVASFGLGIQTAGDVQPVSHSQAQEGQEEHWGDALLETGDINGDGVLTVEDAILVLEVVSGHKTPSREELSRDPNQDYRLTVDDALRILRTLSLR